MKIKIKREGGFIGITSKANLDFDALTEAEQNAFNSLAEQSLQRDNKAKEDIEPKVETLSVGEKKPKEAEIVKSESKSRGLETVEPLVKESKPEEKGLELADDQMPHNMPNGMMRDGFSYSVSMKKDGKTVSLKFDDMTAPPEIVEIFQKYVQY